MRVYAGRNREEGDSFRADLVKMLRIPLGLILTCSNDSHTLSRNQVNGYESGYERHYFRSRNLMSFLSTEFSFVLFYFPC